MLSEDIKSLEMLEFPRIKDILAGFTSFTASRELATGLKPLHNYEQIHLLLQQTREARQLLALDPGFSISGVYDIREPAHMAELERILEPVTLLQIQQTLAALHQLRSNLQNLSVEFPLLWDIAKDLVEIRQVEKDISECIDTSGEVMDNASPNLSNIRQQLRETRGQILDRLKNIIGSPRGRQVLQEDIITEREGRYVILVKVEFRHEIKGIVHDISNTGATVFIEPTATVGLGNALREMVIEERREIERILAFLSGSVGAYADEIERNISLAADIDLTLAKARYARKIKASEPYIINPEEINSNAKILKLVEARHPLLGEKAVPFSVEIGHSFSILVITGPNTGGKTVTLKTIGLLSLMAQAGIPIPAAEGSQLLMFDNVFADIGDEQSIEQTLSTFSWHMGNLVRIIKNSTGRSLVLLDELGTSTDPAEGSALARAILQRFLSRSTITVVTTHFGDLKAFAHITPGLENASLDFNPDTLAPTYRLTIGIPGGSNAMATAARLGLPEEIINDAKSMLTGGSQEMENLLTNLMSEKTQAEALRKQLTAEREQLARQNEELQKEREHLKFEERRLILENRDKIIREAAELHREIRQAAVDLRRELSAARIEEAKQSLHAIRQQMDSEKWHPRVKETPETEPDIIKKGDTILVREAGMTATVLSINEEAQEVEVQAGHTKLRLGLEGVEKVKAQPRDIPPAVIKPAAPKVSPELDLRGKRADEVSWLLDSYLDDAVRSNREEVRIIHGLATGTLRHIVRELLVTHPLAKSFRPGERNEGGDGVTVVRL
jgi:DNA mismatch repair protein MutS2